MFLGLIQQSHPSSQIHKEYGYDYSPIVTLARYGCIGVDYGHLKTTTIIIKNYCTIVCIYNFIVFLQISLYLPHNYPCNYPYNSGNSLRSKLITMFKVNLYIADIINLIINDYHITTFVILS